MSVREVIVPVSLQVCNFVCKLEMNKFYKCYLLISVAVIFPSAF
jgi:hypothetical protein